MSNRSRETTFYLLRHAESQMNTNTHLVGGRSNETPLTQKGIAQSRKLGLYLLERKITPGKVFTSPARRTQETACHSLGQMGTNIDPIISDEIQELGQGRAEGTPRIDVYTPEVLAQIENLGKDFKLPGGESMNDVGTRMHDWVHHVAEEIGDEELESKNIFVYTHGGAIT